jgi:YbbR domain-containing protein
MNGRFVRENLGLKAFALLLSFVVWVWVARHSQLVKVIKVPVLVDAPQGVLIVDYEPKELRTRLDGDPNQVRRVREEEVSARLSIGDDDVRGRRTLPLTVAPRQVGPLPAGLNVEVLDRLVEVTVDRSSTKPLKVAPALSGKLPSSLELELVSADPATVSATGPVAVLSRLTQIPTEPIDLTGRERRFALTIPLAPPDPTIALEPDLVRVVVVLSPRGKR